MEPRFVPQSLLEAWVESGQARFDDGRLSITSDPRSFRLLPAVKIVEVLDGTDDGWLGQVISIEALQAASAEHYHDSVIRGDTAYRCEEGFLASVADAEPATGGAEAISPPTAPVRVETVRTPEELDSELLADFLLKNLS